MAFFYIRGMILAIETGAEMYSVGLFHDGNCIAYQDYFTPRLHNRLITLAAEQVLFACAVHISQLSAVAVTQGPGSYTGLRIGGSAAKGICFALDLPLLPFSTLEAMAAPYCSLAAQCDIVIVPLLDVLKTEIHFAGFNAALQLVMEPQTTLLNEIFLQNFSPNKKYIFCGNGTAKCLSLLKGHLPESLYFPEPSASVRGLGALLYKKFEIQAFADPITFEPEYLKEVRITVSQKTLL